MVELDEEKIRKSFEKVKEDISALKAELSQNKAVLEEIKYTITSKNIVQPNIAQKVPQETKGSYSFIHSFNIHSTDTHSFTQQTSGQNPKFSDLSELDSTFLSLTKQEFLTFMSIYQLEDDQKRKITYHELSLSLKLSEGCIRTYLSQLLKKGLPIEKVRLNNKVVVLGINSHFRNLNVKIRLFNLLNNLDPTQTKLNEL